MISALEMLQGDSSPNIQQTAADLAAYIRKKMTGREVAEKSKNPADNDRNAMENPAPSWDDSESHISPSRSA